MIIVIQRGRNVRTFRERGRGRLSKESFKLHSILENINTERIPDHGTSNITYYANLFPKSMLSSEI